MNRKSISRAAFLAATLALPAFLGCTGESSQPAGPSDKGSGSGATGGVSEGANTSPRRGSAGTNAERTGPG